MKKKSFNNIVKDVLGKYKEVFESLAEKDTLEYDITEWLLTNKTGLHSKIKNILHREGYHLFPKSLYYIYLEQYENAALDIIRDEICSAFNLDPETLSSRVTKQFIQNFASSLLQP